MGNHMAHEDTPLVLAGLAAAAFAFIWWKQKNKVDIAQAQSTANVGTQDQVDYGANFLPDMGFQSQSTNNGSSTSVYVNGTAIPGNTSPNGNNVITYGQAMGYPMGS